MRPHIHLHLPGVSLPAIRHVSWDRPFSWLMAGLDDLKANPLPSLAYGLLFALGGDLIILATLRYPCLLYTSPSPRDATLSRMPSSA